MENSPVTPNYTITATYTHKAWELLVRSDNIVQVNLTGEVYRRSDIDGVISTIREKTNPAMLLVLVIAHRDSRITPDGIRKLFSKASTSYPVAKAYVISKPVHFMLAKICMRLYKPKTPIKFFADQQEAERWLLALISC